MDSAMQPRTLYTMFQQTVQTYPNANAVGFRSSRNQDYTFWTYRQFDEQVRAFRRGLDALGLRKGDRLALMSHENRVEWAIADLAAQSLGIVTVPIYGTLTASQVAYYLRDSGARMAIVADQKQRQKIQAHRAELPSLEYLVNMTGTQAELEAEGALAFDEVKAIGVRNGKSEAELDALSAQVQPDDLATLIYTSGTTGEPKGAMLTHANLLHTPDAVVEEPIAQLGPGDVFLSFLPLSHITERVGGYYLPLRVGACIVYSLGLMTFVDELQRLVRPTALLCVPRLWEAIYEKVEDTLKQAPPKQRRVAEWALSVARKVARKRFGTEGPQRLDPLLATQYALAERLVLRKIRERVTGGRLRYCVSGGAPLAPHLAEIFLGLGVPIMEGYGLSEAGVIAINRPGKQRIGTVGTLLPHVELKLSQDGEILVRSPGCMKGYYNKPQATQEAIDEEGWFHTGDIGELSADGYLKITDRKKDILVLSNGKKVAPQSVEALLKQSRFIAEAVLFGDQQPLVSALIVPDFERLEAWAQEKGLPTDNRENLLKNPEVQKLYRNEIDAHTTDLADFEKVRSFQLVPNAFSIEGGELTPTLKVKRRFVAEKYAALLTAMEKR
jgi:long-chain acyl-CoA synthetase